jgi:membrane protein DedA with SNARE-associated domain
MDWLTDSVTGSPLTYLIALIASGGDVLFPVIPSETIVITAGVLAAQARLHIWLLIPAAAVGAMIGDNIAYLLGAKVGDPIVRRVLRGENNQARLRWAEGAVRGHGTVVVVVGRFIPGGRTATTIACGTLQLPWRRFIAADAIAAVLWAVYASMLGYLGGQAFRDSVWKPLAVSLGIAALVTLGIEGWRRIQKHRGKDVLGNELPGSPEDPSATEERPMARTAEDLERRLRADLARLDDRLVDADFCGRLYRTLANRTWSRRGDDGVHVALSWKRTEELVNGLRRDRGEPPLVLAQTGGEGFAHPRVMAELERLGWTGGPLNTGRHDDAHLDSPEDEPRTPPMDRFAKAHADAERERRRTISP